MKHFFIRNDSSQELWVWQKTVKLQLSLIKKNWVYPESATSVCVLENYE